MNPVADETTNGPDRIGQLRAWLSQALPKAGFSPDNFTLTPASSDASFRRYFRVGMASGTSLIAMDAPPDKENCAPFIAVARLFRDTGVHVPDLVAQEIRLGFLLLSDMGTTTYLDRLLPLRADKGPEAPGEIGRAHV